MKPDVSNDEIANLIFRHGLSTKETVDTISGRGLGMDAVQQYLKEEKAEIKIVSSGEVIDGYLPFKIEIILPEESFRAS